MPGRPLSSLHKSEYCAPKVEKEKCCDPEPCAPKVEAHTHCDKDMSCDDDCDKKHHHGHGKDDSGGKAEGRYNGSYGRGGHWFLNLVIWFIIIAVIVWFILVSTKPTWVQKTDENGITTGEVDQGRALLWAVIIALIIVVVIWLVRYGIRM
uniref:Membrane protein n=1 Tax=Pithovirus LCPAC103 TaxID=2506588 RepID=A0A481Z4E2_9VIRU|nr:MAG: membrane protein [Pithovirus LCPAC103]